MAIPGIAVEKANLLANLQKMPYNKPLMGKSLWSRNLKAEAPPDHDPFHQGNRYERIAPGHD
jgi:hypothetical protein